MADYSISTRITVDSSEFDKNMKKAGDSIKGFSANLQSVTKALGALFVGRELINFGKKSVQLLEKERKETALLNKTLQITGASAWQTQDALVSMAQELERNSNYSQEQIMRAQTVMLGFKSVTGEVFDSAIQNVIDMSEVMGIDLVNSVQTIGKALDDPIKGLGSLSRQGFVFSEQQKAMLANMVEVGDKAGAQKIILEELTSTYGGAGQAGQNAFQKLNVAIGNFQETLASNLVPTITSLAESVTGLLEDFNSLDKGTQTFILTAGGLVTTLPLIVKGIQGIKIALISLQASVPVLLAISAGIVAISAVVGAVAKSKNEFKELSAEVNKISKETDDYLDAYAQGNEEKKLDAKATDELIKKYPELTGKINAYTTSVKEARQAVDDLVQQKLIDSSSTGIEDYIKKLDQIQKLREKASKYESIQNELDRARAKEILSKDIPAVIELANAQRQAINERLKGMNKMLDYSGKVVDIPVQVKPQITPADTETKRRWQEVLAEVLKIDEGSFSTGKQAVGVYLNSVAQTVRQDKSISNALGEAFNIKDVLTAQQENIKQSINDILASVNVDDPFSVEDFAKQNSALAQLAERYRAISNELKGIKINDEIADLEKQVANLGKSELELYKAELKANGATEEQIKQAVKLKQQLMQAEKETTSFADSWNDVIANLKTDANDWSDVTNSINEGIKTVAVNAVESIGASLVEGEDAWDNFGTTALNAIAGILEALAMQLAALAAVNYATWGYDKAVMAMSASAVALAGAGALKALASRTKEVSENLSSSVVSLEEFKERINDILSGATTTTKTLLATETFRVMAEDAKENYDRIKKYQEDYLAWYRAEVQRLIDTDPWGRGESIYNEELKRFKSLQHDTLWDNMVAVINAEKKYKSALNAITDVVDNYNNSLLASISENEQIVSSYKDMFNGLKLFEELKLKETAEGLTEIEQALKSVYATYEDIARNAQLIGTSRKRSELYEDLTETGLGIGEALFNAISEGADKSSFLSEMKESIKKQVIELAIYTEEFTEKLADVGVKLSQAMLSGIGLDEVVDELDQIWAEAEENAKKASQVIEEAFGGVVDVLDEIGESVESLGENIADGLIDGLSNGLSQSDFLQNMYEWIRKLIIQTVVYTESMKAEIEAIGQAIADGISGGFTEDSLHEIRRDLSYIFYSANKQMEGIDDVLSGVFSGYATGTENASRGLHLVGEAGPELVAFNGGEKVYNAEETSRMLNGGNNFNVTFNNTQDTTAFAMVQQLRQYNREMAINGIF